MLYEVCFYYFFQHLQFYTIYFYIFLDMRVAWLMSPLGFTTFYSCCFCLVLYMYSYISLSNKIYSNCIDAMIPFQWWEMMMRAVASQWRGRRFKTLHIISISKLVITYTCERLVTLPLANDEGNTRIKK